MKQTQQGFIGVALLVVAVFAVGGGAYYYHQKSYQPKQQEQVDTVTDISEENDIPEQPSKAPTPPVDKPLVPSFEAKARAQATAGECAKFGTVGVASMLEEEYEYAQFDITNGSKKIGMCAVDMYQKTTVWANIYCTKGDESCRPTGLIPSPRKLLESIPVGEVPKAVTAGQCVAQKGAVLYGVDWSQQFIQQKALFGDSAKYLATVNCDNGSNGQTSLCTQNNITGYPTWIFKDGSRLQGQQSLATITQKLNCSMNTGVATNVTAGVIVGEGIAPQSCLSTTSPYIRITSPVSGALYGQGSTMSIKWHSCNVPKEANVQIMAGAARSDMVAKAWAVGDVKNTGVYTSTIPSGPEMQNTQWGLNIAVLTSPYIRTTSSTSFSIR